MQYYFDINGNFLGGRDDGVSPSGATGSTILVPLYATQTWNGTAWVGAYPGDLISDTDAVAFQLLYHGAPWELFSLFALLKFYGDVPASRKGAWSIVKAQNPAWLTQTWITNMEAYCAANGMPIV